MEFWIVGRTEQGHGVDGIILKGGSERIISVSKNMIGITFSEECDGWFNATYSKDDALKMLDELREWINKQ